MIKTPDLRFDLDEDQVIDGLCYNSKKFKNFYINERTKLGLIEWSVNIDLEEGLLAESGELVEKDLNRYYITIREYPVYNASIIAHEICHLIRLEEGFAPRIRFKDESNSMRPQYLSIKKSLATILEDPIIDSMLQDKYKLDLIKIYISTIKTTKKLLKEKIVNPINDLTAIKLAIDYVGLELEWNLIQDKDALKQWHEFQDLFKSNYPPSISKLVVESLSIIQETGFKTPEKQRSVIDKLINYYNLEKIFYIA